MSTKATSQNEEHREETYEFAPIPSVGKINVANYEYGPENVSDHIYTVSMHNGRAARCTCPADAYHAGACKHRQAVESRDDFARTGNCHVCGGTGQTQDGVTCFYCLDEEAEYQ